MKALFILCVVLNFIFIHIISGQSAKFEPPANKALLIIGQDLGAIGGFDTPNDDGYVDNGLPVPAGVTTYTNIVSLGGLEELDNWGSGDVSGQAIVDNPLYDNSVIAIGLYMVDQLDAVLNGDADNSIADLGQWIKDANRPVFLRIGYEFDGSWNHYDPTKYKNAYKYIMDKLRADSVDNVVSVWQSAGGQTAAYLSSWYPGDDYVDWMGYSHFDMNGGGIMTLAREKNKPVLISESAPKGHDFDVEDGETVWNAWFQPLFNYIEANKDIIKGLAYINVDWQSQPMWNDGIWGDSRVQVNEYIKTKWLEELNKNFWMNASDNLFDSLTVGLIDENFNQPGSIHLYQNYPNPFNPITTISYTVGAHRHAPLYVDLNIYDWA